MKRGWLVYINWVTASLEGGGFRWHGGVLLSEGGTRWAKQLPELGDKG